MSGVSSTSSAIWLASITAAVNFVFTFLGFFLVERIGRRSLTLGSLTGVCFVSEGYSVTEWLTFLKKWFAWIVPFTAWLFTPFTLFPFFALFTLLTLLPCRVRKLLWMLTGWYFWVDCNALLLLFCFWDDPYLGIHRSNALLHCIICCCITMHYITRVFPLSLLHNVGNCAKLYVALSRCCTVILYLW